MKTLFNISKVIGVVLLIVMAFIIFFFVGWRMKANESIISDPSKVKEISAVLYNGEYVKVTEPQQIKDAAKEINEASLTKKKSTQDVPEVKVYGKITITIKSEEKILYYYEKDGKYYVEVPYGGIYQCKQNINDYFESVRGKVA